MGIKDFQGESEIWAAVEAIKFAKASFMHIGWFSCLGIKSPLHLD